MEKKRLPEGMFKPGDDVFITSVKAKGARVPPSKRNDFSMLFQGIVKSYHSKYMIVIPTSKTPNKQELHAKTQAHYLVAWRGFNTTNLKKAIGGSPCSPRREYPVPTQWIHSVCICSNPTHRWMPFVS